MTEVAPSADPRDEDYERQLKKLINMLAEGVADLKAGRVHTAEEIERMLQERRARRIAEKAKAALKRQSTTRPSLI
jgi:hypothetical protein